MKRYRCIRTPFQQDPRQTEFFDSFSHQFRLFWCIPLFFYFDTLPLQSIFKKTVMYAIVEIAGKQFKVSKDQYIYAPKMEGEAGTTVSFDKVLLTDADGSVKVGAPTVKGVKVEGKILEHVKGGKVIVFKKKRRKGYAKRNGHRQQFTKVQIENIG